MSSVELDLGGGLKLAHFLRKRYAGANAAFRILRGEKVVESFSDSQGRIFDQLIQEEEMALKPDPSCRESACIQRPSETW